MTRAIKTTARTLCPALLSLTLLASCSDPTEPPPPPGPAWDWSGIMTGPPTLACSPSTAAFNATVSCLITLPFDAEQHYIQWWDFTGQDGESVIFDSDPYNLGWTGPMIKSGTVRAHMTVNGFPYNPQGNVTINRRSGWSWASSVNGTPANLPDPCVGTGLFQYLGLTAGMSCTLNDPFALFTPATVESSGGYSQASVPGSGPNGGLYYVSSPQITMNLSTQVNRHFREDANPLLFLMAGDSSVITTCGPDRRTMWYVNSSACMNVPAFAQMVSQTWTHELAHLLLALDSAKVASGDLHLKWEPLAHDNAAGLRHIAESTLRDVEAFIADSAICSHTGGTNPQWNVWFNNLFGWSFQTLEGDESKPSHC